MPSVLVTGASRGIGRATADHLTARGWSVFAGVRNAPDAPPGTTPVVLDVTDAAQVAALDEVLPRELDAVVNNAGIVVGSPMEAVALDDLRRQLDVNVVGQVAVTQAVLPRLRASRGRVVFVSSVSGQIATPMTGPYNASKFALEGLADALRMELAPWRIPVVLVQPAQTDTDMWRTAEQVLEEGTARLSPEHRELYAEHIEGWRRSIPRSVKAAQPASTVAEVVERALTMARPRARYVVGTGPRVQSAVARSLPTRVRDGLLRAQAGVPKSR